MGLAAEVIREEGEKVKEKPDVDGIFHFNMHPLDAASNVDTAFAEDSVENAMLYKPPVTEVDLGTVASGVAKDP